MGEVTVPPPGENLRHLLENANDGMTFVLLEGEYSGQVVATASVTLRGAGPGRTRLSYAGKEPAVWAGKATLRLRDLTIQPKGTGPAVVGGSLDLENVEVLDSPSDGIYVVGSRARLVNCVVRGAKQNGVFAVQGAEVELDGCSISFSGGNGVWLREGSRGVIRNSDARRSEYNGVNVSGPGRLEVRGSTLVLNKNAGLAAFHGAELRAESCTARDNDVVGVFAKDESRIELRGCLVSWNRLGGARAEAASHLDIASCTFFANDRDTIACAGGAGLTLSRSILMGEGPESTSRAIQLTEQVGPATIETNDIFYFAKPSGGLGPIARGLALDPVFVSSARGDYRLHPDSPCVLADGHMGAFPPVSAEECERHGLPRGLTGAREAFSRAITAIAEGSLASAEQLLNETLQVDSTYTQAHIELGEVVRRLARPQEALAAFARGVRADWLNVYPYYGLEITSFELGEQDLGRSALSAVNLVGALARVRRNHRIEEMDGPGALVSLGSCILLGNETVFEKELAVYFRRFPDAAARFGGERVLHVESRERKAFREAAVQAVTQLWRWWPSSKPFRVERYEEFAGVRVKVPD